MRSLRLPLASVALIGTVVAVPALAQQAPITYPLACGPSQVSRSDSERAHAVFLSGRQYLDESNYDKAISYFNDAYTIDCSVHGILPIIATAFERRGDRGEAVRALDEYLRRAPDAPDREIVERRIKNLRDQLARERPVAAASLASQGASPPPNVSPPPAVAGPPAAPLPSTSAPADEAPRPGVSDHAPWILVGAGGAVAIAGVVLYAVGAGDISTAQSQCGGKRTDCTAAVADKGNGGRALETAGAIAGGAGVAAVVAGLIWHLASATSSSALGRGGFGPEIAPGYVGLEMRGAL